MAKQPLTKDLQFEKKNQNMVKLPGYARVQKRPIPHPPIASPYAGASVPKTVYVSTDTPFMSAVKRVQKLLRQAEKRAMTSLDLASKKKTEKQKLAQLAQGNEKLRKEEEVFVKATGRAMEKALAIGRWFEARESEYIVRVKTGSVLVVDDVVEDEEAKRKVVAEGEKAREREEKQQEEGQQQQQEQQQQHPDHEHDHEATNPAQPASKSAAKKRKRAAALAEKELPESRTRWVNVVEIAVTYK